MRLTVSHAFDRDPAGGKVVAELSSKGSCRVRAFPRDTRTEAIAAALAWADANNCQVENRAALESGVVSK
jgi:hypothetical protein